MRKLTRLSRPSRLFMVTDVAKRGKIVTVVGARPQFIKAAVVSPNLRNMAQEILVHTGQHYDRLMSDVFFEELSLPRPDYELAIGSATHGAQTGRMLEAIENVLRIEQPQWVMVYGDTNSTLAGALAAAKLGLPVAHVEAGLRSFNRAMPEEINRVVTDHLANRLFCPTATAVQNLAQEGITGGVYLSGDVMDVAVRKIRLEPELCHSYGLSPGHYAVSTVHRQENTDSSERLSQIVAGLGRVPYPVLFPCHPRTHQRILEQGLVLASNVRLVEPVGYREMLSLVASAGLILTDSGGLQREACALAVPTYVLRDETEWVELVQTGQAVLVGANAERVAEAVAKGLATPRVESYHMDPVQVIVDQLRND